MARCWLSIFGKEQLETAARTVTAIARELTPEEKLRGIKVTEKMIPRVDMHVSKEEPARLKLLGAVEELDRKKKGNRLPVLTKDDHPLYVIHRSTIDQFIVKAVTGGKTPDQLKDLTLQDLLQDADLKQSLDKSFAVVPETATLADAKRAMAATSSWCQDSLVTRLGTSAPCDCAGQRYSRFSSSTGPCACEKNEPALACPLSRS